MKRTIIAKIEQPIKIHLKNLKVKQIWLKDLITEEDVLLTMNLKSPVSRYLLGHEGICILNLNYKKGGHHYHPKLVNFKHRRKIKLKHPEFFI
jgi:hypothetical protein